MGLRELGEIKVVSVSKRAEKTISAPATVRVITAEQIRERGYLTLEQALENFPGVQFRNTLGMNSYLFVRGVPNQNNLAQVLIDGVEINELNSGGFYGGGQYNLANVKRIEVMYGPASALYGTNAVSGIINIITENPDEETPGLQISGAYGGFKTGVGTLQFAYYDPQARLGMRVSGMFKTTTHADLTGASNDNMWTPDLELFEKDRSLDVKISFRNFLFGLNYQNRASSSATNYPSVGTIYHDHGTRWDMRFLNTYLQHCVTLSKAISITSRVYARESTALDDSILDITDEGQFRYFRPNYQVGAEIMADTSLSRKLNLVTGLVFENDWLASGFSIQKSSSPDERPPRPSRPDMISNTLVSSYIQGEYKPTPFLQMTAGFRFDCSSVYNSVVTPRAGAVFTWQDLSAKLLFGEAFRAPKPWDYTDGQGNPGLEPERMKSVELSLGYMLKDFVHLEAAIYWNRLKNMITKEIIADQGAWRWVNIGRVDTLGMEVGAELWSGPFRSFVNYTYTRSRDGQGMPIPEIARHGANAGVDCRINYWINASIWSSVLGSRPNPKVIAATGRDKIDTAVVVNASLSFLNMNHFDMQVIARNIFDEVYFHPSNRQPDRYRQPQRTIMVMAGYRF
ncbi:MAG TPA: TonB-dependent receptor [Candidatus Sumerlaeota bacterium]|nr:TonB-dependent receptor [Candidatus Sumerlaeota bacterium]